MTQNIGLPSEKRQKREFIVGRMDRREIRKICLKVFGIIPVK